MRARVSKEHYAGGGCELHGRPLLIDGYGNLKLSRLNRHDRGHRVGAVRREHAAPHADLITQTASGSIVVLWLAGVCSGVAVNLQLLSAATPHGGAGIPAPPAKSLICRRCVSHPRVNLD